MPVSYFIWQMKLNVDILCKLSLLIHAYTCSCSARSMKFYLPLVAAAIVTFLISCGSTEGYVRKNIAIPALFCFKKACFLVCFVKFKSFYLKNIVK